MKRKTIIQLMAQATGVIVLLTACNTNEPKSTVTDNVGYSSVHLPSDVLPSCTVTKDSFSTWFASGIVTENGFITPANSVTFGHQNNCDFYQWSERMFLWLTSPAGGVYGGSGTVMESPVFYTVVADSAGGLKLAKHTPGTIITAQSSIEKNGPNRLPVFSDKEGHLFEVQFHKPGERVLVKNAAGQVIELGAVEKATNALTVLKDKAGKAIEKPSFVTGLVNAEKVVHAFTSSRGTVFFDANGNEIDTGVSQATNEALIAQNGSLVYYITMVNDMYAYFLTAADSGYIAGNQFPTTAAARDSIVAYARKNGYAVPTDSNALAMELKTSWIIADSLKSQAGFVTIEAEIPTYNTSVDSIWTVNGHKKVKLALVGMHIVGSLAGHPEMAWATFEHASNTPNASYQYLNNNGKVQTVAADTTGKWLFSSNPAASSDSFNNAYISVGKNDTLRSISPHSITASNTQRVFPFGVGMTGVPNQQDTSASASNSEIISINNSVSSLLIGNDIRKNYLFIGATWTFGGTAPNGQVYPVNTAAGSSIGTSLLANSTMETYFQANTFSCFTCHSHKNSLEPGALSHVFNKIKPLNATRKAIKNLK